MEFLIYNSIIPLHFCDSDTRKRAIQRQGRSQEGGRGNFKLVMIQSNHRFGLAVSSPNLSESSLAGWAPALLSLGPFGLATRALRAHPPNWIQTNLSPRGETKPVGFIESVGAPPQTPFRRGSGGGSPQQRSRRSGVWGGAQPPPRPPCPPPSGYVTDI